jgi:hypothetical protein
MSRRKLFALLACLCLAIATSAWGEAKKVKSVVSGIVRVASSDAKGNVLSIEIMVGDNEEEPYLVANTAQGQELRKHVGEYVMAAGLVSEDKLGWKTIEILTFQFEDELEKKHIPPSPAPAP